MVRATAPGWPCNIRPTIRVYAERKTVLRRPEDLSTLMRAANRGDPAAYRRLLEAVTPSLRAIVRRGLARANRAAADAEDIVQETLLAMHLKRHTWDESQPLEPWVRAIAHHKLVDALRRRGFRDSVPIEDYAHLPADAPKAEDLTPSECSDLLAELPDRQRQIVQGISIEGYSAREMGDRLGMTEGAVRVALHRALKTLAQLCRRSEP